MSRLPEFVGTLEDVLAATLSNIMQEALKGEVLLTARPRVIALPPSRHDSNRLDALFYPALNIFVNYPFILVLVRNKY